MFAIAGFGFVGQALYSCVSKNVLTNKACYLYDPPLKLGNLTTLKKCSAIFCCLPTPHKNTIQDFNYYENFFVQLNGYRGILIIKSTVLWKNIKPYSVKFNIVSNPEFLRENFSSFDFYNQQNIILGGRIDHCRKVAALYENNFSLKKYKFEFCSLKEAIEIKYFHNIYHAYKSLFWNYVYEKCGNHRKIAKMYHDIVESRNEMSNVASDGKLGYGGSCFTKDVAAFEEERPHELTKFMIEYNKRLRNGK